jgi:cobalt transporter subunit CbtB
MVHLTTAASTDTSQALAVRSASKAWPVALAALLGVFLLYGVGIAGPTAIHNAAHDTRHGIAFPCH